MNPMRAYSILYAMNAAVQKDGAVNPPIKRHFILLYY